MEPITKTQEHNAGWALQENEQNWLSHFRKTLSWIKPNVPTEENEQPSDLITE